MARHFEIILKQSQYFQMAGIIKGLQVLGMMSKPREERILMFSNECAGKTTLLYQML